MNTALPLFFAFIVLLSCKKEIKQQQTVQKKPEMNRTVRHTPYKRLSPDVAKELSHCKGLIDVSDYLERYENIAPSDALNNADELKNLLDDMEKDTIIKTLESPAFNARIHVLENEILRLVDMRTIPAITVNEVNTQVDKILLVFGSVNAKINTVFTQKKLHSEIPLDDFFTLDSTEMRSSKKVNSVIEYDD